MRLIKYIKVLILGSGPSGYTNSIYIYRSNLNPIIITGNQIGGQIINSNIIENWPSIKIVSGKDLMSKFFLQIKNFNIELSYDEIYKSNLLFKPMINISINKIYYLSEITSICTGSLHNNIKLIKSFKNISFCGICDGNFYINKNIALLGGGYTSIYNYIYMSKIANNIILIHRKNYIYSDYLQLINFYKNKKIFNLNIKLNTIIVEFIGNNFNLKYLKIKNKFNLYCHIVYISGFFYFIGNKINSKCFIGQIKTKKLYIKLLLKKKFNTCKTNLSGVFSSGDIHDYLYKQAIISSGYGAISAIDIINFLNIYI